MTNDRGNAAIVPGAGYPLTIVLQGEDSVIKTTHGVENWTKDVTIKSEGDAKLTAFMQYGFLRGLTAGANVILDHANLDLHSCGTYNAESDQVIRVKEADILIKGGNVNITTVGVQLYPLYIVNSVEKSGNVYISDGADVYVQGSYYAVYVKPILETLDDGTKQDTTPASNVYVDNADVILAAKNHYGAIQANNTYKAPIVADTFCAQLKQGKTWDGSDATAVEELVATSNRNYFEITRHALTEVAEVPATCEAEGVVHHWHCEKCDKNFADALATEELAHTVMVGGHKWAEATCTAPKTCTVCGITEGEALGHNVVTLPAVAATCQETGLTEGQYCARCGETLVYRVKSGEMARDGFVFWRSSNGVWQSKYVPAAYLER